MATTTIAELELQITSSSDKAVKGLTDLTTALTSLKNNVKGGLGLKGVTDQINKLGMAIKLFPNLNKLEQLRDILASIKGIGNIDISKGIKEEAPTSQESGGDITSSTSDIEQIKEATDGLDASVSEATQDMEELQTATSNFDVNEFINANSQIDLLTDKLNILKIKLEEAFSKGDTEKVNRYALQIKNVQKQIENLKKPLKDTGKEATKTATGFSKIVKSFGRIAFYRLVRSIIKEITAAFKEGINNLYQFSKETDGSFAQSMDKIATAILSIRNGLGVALAPFIEAIAPLIERIGDKFLEFGNTISKVGAIMNGKGTYTKAVKSMKEYADATEKAKSAAQGFDMLNIAGKTTPDTSSMFETVELKEDTEDTATAFGNILKDVKEIIGELVTTLMPIIRDIAGALMPIIQDLLGNTLGFIKQIMPSLQQILGKVGEIIVALLDKLRPVLDQLTNSGTSQILDDIMNIVNVILDVLMPLLDTIFELLEPIGDIISAIMSLIASIIHSVVETIAPVIKEIWNVLEPIVKVVVDSLKPALEMIAGIIQFIGAVIETVTSLFEGFMVLFSGDAEKIKNKWDEIGEHLTEVWSNVWKTIKKVFVTIINGIITGFESLVNLIIKAINKITGGLSSAWTWMGIPAIPQINEVSWNRLSYATGGYGIPRGQMFIANEMGAEMVGSMDGKTAVANNQQIVEGIKAGVYEAFMRAKGTEDNAINLNVYLSGKQLKAEYDRLNNASGVRIGTGGLAY